MVSMERTRSKQPLRALHAANGPFGLNGTCCRGSITGVVAIHIPSCPSDLRVCKTSAELTFSWSSVAVLTRSESLTD